MSLSTVPDSEVVVLPESDNHTLCVSLKGVVGLEEYRENFLEPLIERADEGPFNLLVHYDATYQGWEKEAADLSFQSIIDYGQKTRRLAYVNPPDSKLLQVKMARSLFSGEIRFFDEEEMDEAIEWVKA